MNFWRENSFLEGKRDITCFIMVVEIEVRKIIYSICQFEHFVIFLDWHIYGIELVDPVYIELSWNARPIWNNMEMEYTCILLTIPIRTSTILLIWLSNMHLDATSADWIVVSHGKYFMGWCWFSFFNPPIHLERELLGGGKECEPIYLMGLPPGDTIPEFVSSELRWCHQKSFSI